MEESRSSTPEPPPQDLWSSILDSVSSSRSTPSKQMVLLGQPSSGKSTLATALLQKSAADDGRGEQKSDFALGYDFADVRDDGDEDTLARLSVYTVPSSSHSYMALLPHFIPPRTSLPHTLIMIVLDWTRPWAFIEELQHWLAWVEAWVNSDSSREMEVVREECRERLQSHLHHFAEFSSEPLPATSALSSTLLPLGPGTFTHNPSGVPIIVVCTKADLIDETSTLAAGSSGMGGMVKGKGGEWEERTDSVMQVLRTICLKYGAALFYTTPLPSTLQVLRQYALHLLFTPPAPQPGLGPGADPPAPIRNPFPFCHKSNILDRDRIVVPAGWDSWGKITVMRDSFDPRMWGEAWERDLERSETGDDMSAVKLFASLVPDQGGKPPSLPPFNSPVPEQAFLAKNYDENAKKPDRDPRGAFRNPADLTGAAAGVVGPLGSSSFSLPHVERALSEMEVGTGNALSSSVSGDAARRVAGRASARPLPSTLSASTTGPLLARTPTSPTALPTASPSPTSGQTQHEVLQNFFQSLLTSKDRAGAVSAATKRTTTPKTNGNNTEEGAG